MIRYIFVENITEQSLRNHDTVSLHHPNETQMEQPEGDTDKRESYRTHLQMISRMTRELIDTVHFC